MSAIQLGTAAAVALVQARHGDGSNQLGDLAPRRPHRLDRLRVRERTRHAGRSDALAAAARHQRTGRHLVQKYVTPHWGQMRPFALPPGCAFRPALAPFAPGQAEMDQLIAFSAVP